MSRPIAGTDCGYLTKAERHTIETAVRRWEDAKHADARTFTRADNALGMLLCRGGPCQIGMYVYRYDAGSDAVVRNAAARLFVAG